jgi:hypothetical protein
MLMPLRTDPFQAKARRIEVGTNATEQAAIDVHSS